MGSDTWITVVREIGILATACGFFVYTSWLREERMSKRISELETFVETKLVDMVAMQVTAIEKCSAAMNKSAEAMEVLTEATIALERQSEKVLSSISFRPCLLPDSHPAKIKAAEELAKAMNHG